MTETSPAKEPLADTDPALKHIRCQTTNEGVDARSAQDRATALDVMHGRCPNPARLDLNRARSSGDTHFYPRLARHSDAKSRVLTGNGAIATAVEAIKLNADACPTELTATRAARGAFDTNDPLTTTKAPTARMLVERIDRRHRHSMQSENCRRFLFITRAAKCNRRTRHHEVNNLRFAHDDG